MLKGVFIRASGVFFDLISTKKWLSSYDQRRTQLLPVAPRKKKKKSTQEIGVDAAEPDGISPSKESISIVNRSISRKESRNSTHYPSPLCLLVFSVLSFPLSGWPRLPLDRAPCDISIAVAPARCPFSNPGALSTSCKYSHSCRNETAPLCKYSSVKCEHTDHLLKTAPGVIPSERSWGWPRGRGARVVYRNQFYKKSVSFCFHTRSM